jgi:hypothetical protein
MSMAVGVVQQRVFFVLDDVKAVVSGVSDGWLVIDRTPA